MPTRFCIGDLEIDLEQVVAFEPWRSYDSPGERDQMGAAYLLWDKPELFLANTTLSEIEQRLRDPESISPISRPERSPAFLRFDNALINLDQIAYLKEEAPQTGDTDGHRLHAARVDFRIDECFSYATISNFIDALNDPTKVILPLKNQPPPVFLHTADGLFNISDARSVEPCNIDLWYFREDGDDRPTLYVNRQSVFGGAIPGLTPGDFQDLLRDPTAVIRAGGGDLPSAETPLLDLAQSAAGPSPL